MNISQHMELNKWNCFRYLQCKEALQLVAQVLIEEQALRKKIPVEDWLEENTT
jgi:hypothetical protein